jgi:thiosulfate dehydrogenase
MMIRKSTLAALGASFILGLAVTVSAHADAVKDASKYDSEYKASVNRGDGLFHGGIKSSNEVACVQCHPEASNTHAETYPKYQKQLGKVSQMWEMINWCIENPLESKAIAADSQDMVDLAAYMTNIRKGKALEPGKY